MCSKGRYKCLQCVARADTITFGFTKTQTTNITEVKWRYLIQGNTKRHYLWWHGQTCQFLSGDSDSCALSIWWQKQPNVKLSLFWSNNHARETRGIFEGFYLGLRYDWFSVAPRPLCTLYHLDKRVDCGEQKYLRLSGIERILRYSTIQPQKKENIPDEERVFLLTRSR